MDNSYERTNRWFIAGLTTGVFSSLLLTCAGLHYRFVFLPEYYGSFAEMFWQKPAINFDQCLAYLRTTTGKVFVMVPLGGILLGFGLMQMSQEISNRAYKQNEKETVEQWLKENPPQKHKSKKAKQGRQAKKR